MGLEDWLNAECCTNCGRTDETGYSCVEAEGMPGGCFCTECMAAWSRLHRFDYSSPTLAELRLCGLCGGRTGPSSHGATDSTKPPNMGDKPRLLDLFCGAGGAAMGYSRAGFEVVGVDIKPQPRFPFQFIQADALDYCREHGHEYDAIHASPPCQAYSPLKALSDKEYPDLIPATREALQATGRPWAIENVMSAPLLSGVTLCGGMFGLRTYRHRRFESSVFMLQPPHPKHVTPTRTKRRREGWDAGEFVSITGDVGVYVGPQAMGIDWMTGDELSQAIPPAYTEHIGRQLIQCVKVA